MTFLTLSLEGMTLATTLAPPAPDCSRPVAVRGERRVFTNADLERIAACRPPTETPPESATAEGAKPSRAPARGSRSASAESVSPDAAEADWRARWRSVDQKARALRREARDLQLEADEAPRDPKKKPTGRKSKPFLISRARDLETEARELEDEFQARARREGALPGWLRSR